MWQTGHGLGCDPDFSISKIAPSDVICLLVVTEKMGMMWQSPDVFNSAGCVYWVASNQCPRGVQCSHIKKEPQGSHAQMIAHKSVNPMHTPPLARGVEQQSGGDQFHFFPVLQNIISYCCRPVVRLLGPSKVYQGD